MERPRAPLKPAIYALMGAIAFYDRATDKASAYFRYVIAMLSIRDLWTKLEFELLTRT